jgi:hypothetical protein
MLGSTILCTALLCTAAAGLHAPLAAAARTAPPVARARLEPSTAKYVLEIWFEIEPGSADRFDDHAKARMAFAARLPKSLQRWVDAIPASGGRVVSLPARTLAEFDLERRAEIGLKAVMGEAAYDALAAAYRQAQLSRTSYLRQVRSDLSWNRAGHIRHRLWGSEVARVTVVQGKEREFTHLWQKVLSAYRTAAPAEAFTVTETLVGGGAQFVVTRPLASPEDWARGLHPADAVARAFGPSAGLDFRSRFDAVVLQWEAIVLERTPFDAEPGPRS